MREHSTPRLVDVPPQTNITDLLLRQARKSSDPALFSRPDGQDGWSAPEGGHEAAPATRARLRDASRRGRRVMLRLSEDEYATVARAAGEVGLTPSGYAAEASIAAATHGAAPSCDPIVRALAELIEARLELRRFIGTVPNGKWLMCVLRLPISLDMELSIV